MLKGGDLREKIHMLMEQRKTAYDKAADCHIQTDQKNFEEIIEDIKNEI